MIILINFIYEKIESSRRIGIRAMYLLVKELSNLTQEEQNAKMHKYIAKYFSSTESLDAVYNSQSDGIQEIYDVCNTY